MRIYRDSFTKIEDDARFANSGFAGQQNHLALALSGLAPPVQQELQFMGAAHQGREIWRSHRREPAFRVDRPDDPPNPNGVGETPQLTGSQVFIDESLAQELAGAVGDQHLVHRRHALQARREIGRHTDDQFLGGGALAGYIADHDETRCDTHPHLQAFARRRHQGADCLHDG